ncbi:MAG: class I SAM-dependent methyltransferase [Haloechinothrix sp.]
MRKDIAAVRGSSTVRRVLEAELVAARERGSVHPRVIDVGGGSGVWAVPLAAEGCEVTVVEPNPNALATLHRRAEEEGVSDRITVVADDTDALLDRVAPGSADLVLAHGLLEVVDDPAAVIAAIAATLSADGAVSVLVANRHAAVLHRALAGKFDEARQLLADPNGILPDDGDPLLRRFDSAGLQRMLAAAGLDIAVLQGDGVVVDSVPDTGDTDLADFELEAAQIPPLRDIASRLHALARRAG